MSALNTSNETRAQSSSEEPMPDFLAEAQTAPEVLTEQNFGTALLLATRTVRMRDAVIHEQIEKIVSLAKTSSEFTPGLKRLPTKPCSQGRLEDKILDKDDEIHDLWAESQQKGRTIERKDRELAEKEVEVVALRTMLNELRAKEEAKVGGGKGEKSTKRRRCN
ncbi:hypothetical protein SBOR_4895 [Sclerotinia borealis F-4128]|uniref:Uncharacterized protein n=1 Tax=Sclerotinia borealis (strain F-4128) TaxID=1432307 RepID=W9CFQ6_SCLBF|nr:hypothetical protein SBOR_4895 [Sclerotinia borealis F-4128]